MRSGSCDYTLESLGNPRAEHSSSVSDSWCRVSVRKPTQAYRTRPDARLTLGYSVASNNQARKNVSVAETVISNLGAYNWNAKVYDTLALASRIAAAVKNRGNVIRIAYHLRELNKSLEKLIELVNSAMKGEIKQSPNAEQVTAQVLRSNADNFEQMYRTLDYIVEGSRRAGLTNNSLTASSVRGLQRRIDPIANLADWFDLASQPDAVGRIFERAKRERESGELTDLAQVE